MNVRRATADEAADYASTSPEGRPLWGFAAIDSRQCPIEILSPGDAGRYEVRAPHGFRFAGDDVSGLVCRDLGDLRERVGQERLEREVGPNGCPGLDGECVRAGRHPGACWCPALGGSDPGCASVDDDLALQRALSSAESRARCENADMVVYRLPGDASVFVQHASLALREGATVLAEVAPPPAYRGLIEADPQNGLTAPTTLCDTCGDESNSSPGLTCGRMIFERDADEGTNSTNGSHPGWLNPAWVEALMGAPAGWTDLPEETLRRLHAERGSSEAGSASSA